MDPMLWPVGETGEPPLTGWVTICAILITLALLLYVWTGSGD